ncbi:MAG TPA: zf-HC2 domain-containing protein [Anaeromyxobacter sp.]|nr:zf-HC2 domain-containing protein [Anaeromyxobacter sp.]
MIRLPLDLGCRDVVELVTDYLEGRLPADERTRFELHLGYCDSCRIYLRQMRQVLSATGRLGEESISPEAREALLRAFRSWKAGQGGGQ